MKKNFLKILPYALGLVYLAYCLINIEAWVLSHTEEYLFFVILAWIVAIILTTVFLVLRLIKKKNYKFYLPIFFFIIGFVINVVATNIPCCTGG